MIEGGNSAVRTGDARFTRSRKLLRPRSRSAGVPHALPNTRALVGSLLCVGAALLAWFAAAGGTDVPARAVIVAARDIPAGVVVGPEDVEIQSLVVPNSLGERTFSAEVSSSGRSRSVRFPTATPYCGAWSAPDQGCRLRASFP